MDSIEVPFIKEAAVIFAFYACGVLIFAYIATFHIKETEYFNGEEDVVIPKHVLSEHAHEGQADDKLRDMKVPSAEDKESSVSV